MIKTTKEGQPLTVVSIAVIEGQNDAQKLLRKSSELLLVRADIPVLRARATQGNLGIQAGEVLLDRFACGLNIPKPNQAVAALQKYRLSPDEIVDRIEDESLDLAIADPSLQRKIRGVEVFLPGYKRNGLSKGLLVTSAELSDQILNAELRGLTNPVERLAARIIGASQRIKEERDVWEDEMQAVIDNPRPDPYWFGLIRNGDMSNPPDRSVFNIYN